MRDVGHRCHVPVQTDLLGVPRVRFYDLRVLVESFNKREKTSSLHLTVEHVYQTCVVSCRVEVHPVAAVNNPTTTIMILFCL